MKRSVIYFVLFILAQTASVSSNNEIMSNLSRKINSLNHTSIQVEPQNMPPRCGTGIKGDVNMDCVIDTNDVNLIVDLLLGAVDCNSPNVCCWAADCNNDGVIDILDIQTTVNWSISSEQFQVIVPIEGEKWIVGIQKAIKWNPYYVGDTVKIAISINYGNSWSEIVKTSNNGTYFWTPENKYISKDCLIKVFTENSCLFSCQSDKFEIQGNPSDCGQGIKGDVNMDCIIDSSDVNLITEYILSEPDCNDPNVCCWAADCNNDGIINILDVQMAVNWTLGLDQFQVKHPLGGFKWMAQVGDTIKWEPSYVGDFVTIEISTDNGNSWSKITRTENDSIFFWIPSQNHISKNCIIKIYNENNCGLYTCKSDKFEIVEKSTHFTFKTTDESYSIVVDDATLDGKQLVPGDEIGVFTPDGLCVGASKWTGEKPLALVAWRDDPQTEDKVDGYKDGEEMSFKIWNQNAANEFPAYPKYSKGDGTFGYSIYSQISMLEAFSVIEHAISLPNNWSWISSFIDPIKPNVEDVFMNTKNLQILVDGNGNFYIPDLINTIGNWQVLKGYKIKVSDNDSVIIKGSPVPTNTPIPLVKRWNFIPYLPKIPMAVEKGLNSIVPILDIAQNDVGDFYIPNLINNIGNMEIGEGYKIHLQDTSKLIYPSDGNQLFKICTSHRSIDSTKHFKYKSNTGESYSIVIENIQIGDQQIDLEDEIGVFTSDSLCVGATIFSGSLPIGFAAWKDDSQTSDVDGYESGDVMNFRIWDSSENKEYTAQVNFVNSDSTFESGIFCHIQDIISSINSDNDPLPRQYFLSQNYPNPFNPTTTFKYQLPISGTVRIDVVNSIGQNIKTLIDAHHPAGYHTIMWDGKNSVGNTVSNGVYIIKFQANNFITSRKMLFMR